MSLSQIEITSFKVELLNGIHAFGTTVVRAGTTADTFKIALYTSSASLDADTTAYSTTNEVTGTGYTAGGETIAIAQVPTSTNAVAWLDFTNTTWSNSTITARYALIYNSTQSDKAVGILDFGQELTSSSTDFVINWPVGAYSTAIIQVG